MSHLTHDSHKSYQAISYTGIDKQAQNNQKY